MTMTEKGRAAIRERKRQEREDSKRESEWDRYMTRYLDVIIREGTCMTESSLNRIFDHISRRTDEPFALITVFVSKHVAARELGYLDDDDPNPGALPDQEWRAFNNKQQSKLVGAVMKDYSFIELEGWYEYKDEKTGEKKKAAEETLFVIGIPPEEAYRLGYKFLQESVLIGDETGIYLYYCRGDSDHKPGTKERIGQKISTRTFEFGYSAWRSRVFSFQDSPFAGQTRRQAKMQKSHGKVRYGGKLVAFDESEEEDKPRFLGLGIKPRSWNHNYSLRQEIDRLLKRKYGPAAVRDAIDTGDVSLLRK